LWQQLKGLSLRALAAKVGVNHSHLSRIEAGTATARFELVAKLAKVLEAPELFIAAGFLPPWEFNSWFDEVYEERRHPSTDACM
jgi:transcriptional regulator with XRE-family HTH domain